MNIGCMSIELRVLGSKKVMYIFLKSTVVFFGVSSPDDVSIERNIISTLHFTLRNVKKCTLPNLGFKQQTFQ